MEDETPSKLPWNRSQVQRLARQQLKGWIPRPHPRTQATTKPLLNLPKLLPLVSPRKSHRLRSRFRNPKKRMEPHRQKLLSKPRTREQKVQQTPTRWYPRIWIRQIRSQSSSINFAHCRRTIRPTILSNSPPISLPGTNNSVRKLLKPPRICLLRLKKMILSYRPFLPSVPMTTNNSYMTAT